MNILIKNAHLIDCNQNFIGDLYINEPNGKIYEINKIKNKSISAIYLGTITAPAPKAETVNIPAFFDAGNGIYKKQQAYVKSSVKDLNNTDLVFNEKLSYDSYEDYYDGVKLFVNQNYMIPSLGTGLV